MIPTPTPTTKHHCGGGGGGDFGVSFHNVLAPHFFSLPSTT
jgi:hypothetical protein